MIEINFAPLVDVPLVAAALGLFIWHIERWARRHDLETTVDVSARLPAARFRLTLLFVGILLLCWSINFAAWSIFALLLGMTLAIAVIVNGFGEEGGEAMLGIPAYFVREWAFGFPELILRGAPRGTEPSTQAATLSILVGKTGVTTSPLRPTGAASIDGIKYSVASQEGDWIDTGVAIEVMSFHNGFLVVNPIPPPSADVDLDGTSQR